MIEPRTDAQPTGPDRELAERMTRLSFEITGNDYALEKMTPDEVTKAFQDYRERAVEDAETAWQAERERIARLEEWLTLPNEQAWWWYWIGSDYVVPHICYVMVSKTGAKDRYFISDGKLAPWCDELEGFWLKVEYPNIPTRERQAALQAVARAALEGKR